MRAPLRRSCDIIARASRAKFFVPIAGKPARVYCRSLVMRHDARHIFKSRLARRGARARTYCRVEPPRAHDSTTAHLEYPSRAHIFETRLSEVLRAHDPCMHLRLDRPAHARACICRTMPGSKTRAHILEQASGNWTRTRGFVDFQGRGRAREGVRIVKFPNRIL